jgi:integrase
MGYKLLPPGTRRNNTTYIVRGTVGGVRFEERTGQTDREDADLWALDYITKLKSLGPAPKTVTFGDAARAYMAWKKPRTDDEKWIFRLIDWMGSRDVREIKADDINKAADALCVRRSKKKAHIPLSNETRIRYVYTPCSSILHYAAEQDWCVYRRIRRPSFSRRSKRAPASDATVRLLLSNTSGHQHLILAWLYETGQRISDSLHLMRSDVDLGKCVARVGSRKTDDRGEIGISHGLAAMLNAAPHLPSGRVFPWDDRWAVYRWLRPLCKRLGVQYTPHQSRHAMATDLRALGYDMRAIAERGLWRDERSAGRYVHHRSTAVPERGVVLLLGQTGGQKKTSG